MSQLLNVFKLLAAGQGFAPSTVQGATPVSFASGADTGIDPAVDRPAAKHEISSRLPRSVLSRNVPDSCRSQGD